ncbi:MAG: hypothetical protein R2757_03850 [Draconibacterium sp.]
MNIKFDSIIDHELRIIREKVIGRVTVDEIIKYRDEKTSSPEYLETYNILLDISNGEIVDFLDNMHFYIEFLIQLSKRINFKRKYAILTAKPMDVVHAHLFIERMEELKLGTFIKAFSEEKNALGWLSVS